jgi:hypothetical protein
MVPPDLANLMAGPPPDGPLRDTGGPPGPDVLVGGPPGSGLEDTGGPPGPDARVGGPPPDSGRGAPPRDKGSKPGAVTSDHTDGNLDFIRTAIMSLQHFAEVTDDDVELAKVHKGLVGLQSILADHASTKDKALGMTPALQQVRRSRRGY